MSIFADMGLDTAPDDPNLIPDNTYRAVLFDAKYGPTKKDPNKKGITFVYKITEGDYAGSQVREWKSCNPNDDERTKGFLKQRLVTLGVPNEKMKDLDLQEIFGTEVFISVKNREGYANVNRVTLASEADFEPAGVGSDSSNPFGL